MSLATVSSVADLRTRLSSLRAKGMSVGLIPTMGGLHEGHLSLVDAARASQDFVVASIFVNPLQFGEGEDLDFYPRLAEADAAQLEKRRCDLLFLPEVAEIYPDGFATKLEMTGLTDVLCGATRPGHFSGVLTVVLKLFNIVRPHMAFFGRKDYQQAVVIRRMVRDLDLDLEIRVCPTVRDPDGVALSSRNRYLSAEERAQAPALRGAFLAMDAAFGDGERDAGRLLAIGRDLIGQSGLFRLDYLEVCDPETLASRTGEVRRGDLVALAAYLGNTRLIDNGLLGCE